MRWRHIGLVLGSLLVGPHLLAACGSNGDPSVFGDGDAGIGGGDDGSINGFVGTEGGVVGDGSNGGCTPGTCDSMQANCGPIGDGCGNVLQCGTCSAPQSCGGAGVPSKCGDGTGANGEPCLAPFVSCNSDTGPVCANLASDSNDCGSCGTVCPPGLTCSAGACTPQCSGVVACDATAGEVCVGDHCANACDVVITGTSSLGCEFWPVHLWNTEDGPGYFQGPLGVVASNTSTTLTATVTLEDAAGTIQTQMVAPGAAATFTIPNARNRLTQTQSASSFHLRSNVPIAAYEYNPIDAAAAFTGSAALLLPTHTLSQSYFVVSYPFNAGVGTSPPQGQGYLAVIGTQPSTHVQIKTPVATLASTDGTIPAAAANTTINLTIGRGQVVEIAEANSLDDITGALVTADKPIAAFGGSGTTTVPDTAPGGDHFEAQLFPTAAWGTSYECEKYTKRSPIDKDRWRIVAGVDNTTVTLSDPTIATVPTLAAGQVFEFVTDKNFDLNASHPVLVAHYLQAWGTLAGSQYDPAVFPHPMTNPCPYAGSAGDAQCVGDANMTLAIPTAQYLSSYTFYTPASYGYSYVDVIAPMGAQVMLDGAAIPALTAIGGGTYGLAQIPVTAGVHKMSGNKPFGVTLYGYDYAISYTCVGGLDLKKIGIPNPGNCTPKTCLQQGFNCGAAGDGCGGLLNCGTCTGGQTCGGGGVAEVCGGSSGPK